MFPPNFMSTIYFFFGLAQAITDYIASVSARQEAFTVNRADYPHIGEHPDRLVLFFSRMGYVRKQAYEEAERTGAAGNGRPARHHAYRVPHHTVPDGDPA